MLEQRRQDEMMDGPSDVSLQTVHLDDLLEYAISVHGSDLHMSAGLPPMVRVDGRLAHTPWEALRPVDIQRLVYDILTGDQIQRFEATSELDFSYWIGEDARFRGNIYRQRGSVGAALRAIPGRIPNLEELRLPLILEDFARLPSGLVLVTGPTGTGKSTTLAAMIDVINNEKECHILTVEDPIEYLHTHKRAMVNQREMGTDTQTFSAALRAALREDPDVLLIGEMRDLETIQTALTMAETGHLVLATLHTRTAPQTVDRIVDVFPSHQQDQIRVQLASALEAVVGQQLCAKVGGGRIAACEVMVATSAVRNLIREGKTFQIPSVIETGSAYGMQTMDSSLAELYRRGQITLDEAMNRTLDREAFRRLVQGSKF
ncbi:MAG TPA: type IV pilus twitching motility protein PilT [Armatimonadota bacterium]|jgi:twitching motility protein PilT